MQTKHKEWEPLPKSALKERVLAATRQWFSPIREIVSSTQVEDIVYLGGFYDEDPLQHACAGTLLLLGDAAHPMSPFRGEGANMAMLDALSFVDVLQTAEEGRLEQAPTRYEHEMLARAKLSCSHARPPGKCTAVIR